MSDETPRVTGVTDDEESAHPLLDWRIVEGRGNETWVSWLSPEMHWVLDEHRMKGDAVLPGTGHMELVRAAFEEYTRTRVGNGKAIEFSNVALLAPLAIPGDGDREVRIVFKKRGDVADFRTVSRLGEGSKDWTEHCGGSIRWVDVDGVPKRDLAAIRKRCDFVRKVAPGELVPKSDFLVFGPRWKTTWDSIKEIHFAEKEQINTLALGSDFEDDLEHYNMHPALLDAALFVHPRAPEAPRTPHLPFTYSKITVYAPLTREISSHIEHLSESRFNVNMMDAAGNLLVRIDDYELRPVDEKKMEQAAAEAAAAAASAGAQRIEIGTPGMLETLAFQPMVRRAPAAHEVEIEVRATGLNFKDVLYALGVLPSPNGLKPKIGMECAGIVTAVGSDVKGLAVGDEVFGMSLDSYATHVTTPAIAVGKKPKHLSFAEAAAIPNAFYTAWYALVTLGRMKPGEKVLVHTAAGGVGLAAVKICHALGAEVIATAGSEEKRDYLRKMGIEHVMNSRTLEWADQIKEVTGGRGVDLVLNSLAGDYITKGLEALAPYGRFLELGIRDMHANTPIGLAPFLKSLSFFAVMVSEDVPNFRGIWDELMAKFDDRTLEPLPTKVFPVAQIDKAFEFMSRAKHIGKLAVEMER